MSFCKRVEQIVYKIIKSETSKIIKIIISKNLNLEAKLYAISPLVKTQYTPDKSFIASRIGKYLGTYTLNSVCDFGGGNGEFLEALSKHFNAKVEKVCIESNTEWYEPYKFNKENIKYELWDSKSTINLNYDVVFAISVLHHLNNEEKKLFLGCVPKGTILIIKEHDVKSSIDKDVIDWEHHIYHLTKSSDVTDYLKTYKTNFMSKLDLIGELQTFGFELIDEFGRLFDKAIDKKNPSCLYWIVLRKV